VLSVIEEEEMEAFGGIEDDLSDDSDQSDCMGEYNGPDQDNKKKFNSADLTPIKGRFKQSSGPHSQGGTSPEPGYMR
jgi:hypothetical protein